MTAGAELVLEVGGTTMRAARFDPVAGRLLGKRRLPTPEPAGGGGLEEHHTRVVEALAGLGSEVMEGARPSAVGIAYAGPVDEHGRVLAAPTVLRGRQGRPYDLPAACRTRWPATPVVCLNDVTAAGHAWAARGSRDFVVLTVGSGIGHKVFLDGVPRVGRGRGGEIGHLRLDFEPDAPRCDCGGRGHLGALASGRGTAAQVARRAREDEAGHRRSALAHLDPAAIRGEDVARAFRAGDPFTQRAVAVAVRHLGTAVAALHLDTGVEEIVVLGGFAHDMGEGYRRLLVAAAAEACWSVGQDWDRMLRWAPDADDLALDGLGRVCARLPG
jgi:glucokinase